MNAGIRSLRIVVMVLTIVVLTLSLSISAWLATPSIEMMTPISLEYDKNTHRFTFVRKVQGTKGVYASWIMQAYAQGGRLQCTVEGHSTYEPSVTVVEYPAPPNLLPCLEDDKFYMVVAWEVRLFGVIPLRPTFLRIPPEQTGSSP